MDFFTYISHGCTCQFDDSMLGKNSMTAMLAFLFIPAWPIIFFQYLEEVKKHRDGPCNSDCEWYGPLFG